MAGVGMERTGQVEAEMEAAEAAGYTAENDWSPSKKSWRRGLISKPTRLLKRLRAMHAGMIERNECTLSLQDLFDLYKEQGGLCGYFKIPMNLRTGSAFKMTVSGVGMTKPLS